MLFKNAFVFTGNAFEALDVAAEDGVITAVGALDGPGEDCTGRYLLPGLVDLHTHGCGGRDFDTAGPDQMREMEKTYSTNVPLVAFCDLKVVNSRLEVKDDSFFHARGIERMVFKERFFHLTNMVPGCTMLFNRIARDTASPYQESKYIIHDYHIILNALAHGGHIAGIPQPLISYRQHDDNVVGAGEKSDTVGNRLKSLGDVFRENKERYQAVKSITGLSLFTYLIIKIQSLLLISRK